MGAPIGSLQQKTWVASVMPGKRAGLQGALLTKLDNICGRMKAQGHATNIFWGLRTLAQQVEIATRGRNFMQFKTFVLAEAQKNHITQTDSQTWINYYNPAVGKHPMTAGFAGPVTWTLKSRHLSGNAADVAHPTKGWQVDAAYKQALKASAVAEGLHIGPPASDWAHVEW
jgi:hypothetical protein